MERTRYNKASDSLIKIEAPELVVFAERYLPLVWVRRGCELVPIPEEAERLKILETTETPVPVFSIPPPEFAKYRSVPGRSAEMVSIPDPVKEKDPLEPEIDIFPLLALTFKKFNEAESLIEIGSAAPVTVAVKEEAETGRELAVPIPAPAVSEI